MPKSNRAMLFCNLTRYLILVGLFLLSPLAHSFGQNIPAIQLDRPDQTECPFITPKKYIQVEHGFTIENATDNVINYSYPSSLFKYGVTEKFELRLIGELVSEKNVADFKTGITPLTIGFKAALIEEKGMIPKTSFIGHLTTSNVGSKDFQAKFIAPAFRFTMQHTVSERIALAYNLGAEWNGEIADQTYIYTLTTGLSLTKKIGFYAEIYGYLQNETKADHRLDCGFTFLVNQNCMVDLSGGIGITEIAPRNYLSLGLSYRFKTSKK